MTELPQDKLDSRREIEIEINLRGIAKFYRNFFHDWPQNLLLTGARKLDEASKNWMTGKAAVVSMPGAIIARNSARVAHNMAEGRYGILRGLVSTVGAASAWGALGYAAFGALSTMTAVAGTVGTVGAAVVAAVVTAPVVLPAFTASTILGATIMGLGAATLSLVPAAANLLSGVSLRRTIDAFKGVKYDEAALKSKLDKDSVASEYYRRQEVDLQWKIARLPEENQQVILKGLKERFEKAAEKPAAEETLEGAAPEVVATPAAAPDAPAKKADAPRNAG